jgi:hypothetical protein
MKTKLVPLALLIPAVVLAQSGPQAPAPQPPQNQQIPKTIEQNAKPNPAGINKAAAAQALSKARSKRSSNNLGRGEASITYITSTPGGDRLHCSMTVNNTYCTNTMNTNIYPL